VINGGPSLLRNGKIKITAFSEGFHWQDNPEFYYRFGVRRNPRTLAGITASGKLLFVTVDGRQAGWSVGVSFEESARIMRSLGATDAVNLDGGGSITITINQQLINRPSDSTGERPIADAIGIQSGIHIPAP
jgi:exopolysaccharide biosynthesis protein